MGWVQLTSGRASWRWTRNQVLKGSELNFKRRGGRAGIPHRVNSRVKGSRWKIKRSLWRRERIHEVWLMGGSTENKVGELGSRGSGAPSPLICLLNKAKEPSFPVTIPSSTAHVLGPANETEAWLGPSWLTTAPWPRAHQGLTDEGIMGVSQSAFFLLRD